MNSSSLLLSVDEWQERAKKHEALIKPFTDAFLKRKSVGQTHAVHDFLFTYYSCSPLKLRQWVPSFEEELLVSGDILEEYPWINECWFRMEESICGLRKEKLHATAKNLAKFVANLCDNILERTPRFGCFGLHEWAMVYKASEASLRHTGYPLRLSCKEIEELVESRNICCTHYDAFRFFTEEAKPLNTFQPVLETRLEMEQAGCLHANMDIYKWAIKLWPWIGSDFLAKAFFVALQGRELDMKASPYDLKHLGYKPICIETEEGKRQYQKEQQYLTECATSLRKDLSSFCKRLVDLN